MNGSVNILGPAFDDSLIALLARHQDVVLLFATFGGMIVLLVLESLRPRRGATELPISRWLNNWLLAYINFVVVLWLVHLVGSSLWAGAFTSQNELLGRLHPALAIFVLLLLVEFGSYALHRLFHAVPLLWRFHAVHHLDTEVDVTTSHRHHTVESAMASLLFLPIFLVLDAPASLVVLVALLRLAVILISHSNLYLPEQVDRVLRWFMVTPDFHRLHHHSDPQYTNSNYGAVVPWFDYLFKTASSVPFCRQENMELGLQYLREPGASRIDRLLLLPIKFKRKVQETSTGQGGRDKLPLAVDLSEFR